MWRPGRRMFSIACFLILITAALHTIGNMAGAPTRGPEENGIRVMQEVRLNMGMGMEPSMYDIFRTLTFTMSVTFTALGVIGLILTGSKSVSSGVIRNITWFYALWNGAFTALCFYYRIPPPLICGVLIELTLIIVLLPSTKSAEEPATGKV
jgi:hypothetical protein